MFSKVYPGHEFSRAVINNVISSMTFLAEDFLIINDIRSDEFEHKKRLLNQLNKRNLNKLFEKNLKKALSTLEHTKVKDENYHFRRFVLESIKFEFYNTRTPIGKSHPLYIQRKEIIDYFVNYFLITMLKEYFDMMCAEDLIKFDYKFTFFDEVMQHISGRKNEYKKILPIDILHRFLLLFKNSQNEAFEDELKTLIESNKNTLEKNDYRNFMLELYNYYKQKEDQGIKSYGMKSFKLMDEMLIQGLFFQKDGLLSAHTYINLVSSALRENEMTWAENFINEYKSKVQPDQRVNAYLFSYASLYYVKGSRAGAKSKAKFFTTALGYLARVKSEDFYYMIRIKNTLLRIYYDLGDFELAISIIDAYKHFLSKTKTIPENLYEQYYNFIGFTGKLIKMKTQETQMTIEQLQDEITSTKLISYRGWLLEKAAEIKNSS